MDRTPYLEQATLPRMMKESKGSLKPTIFGVIGRTAIDPYTKVLGGLVVRTTKENAGHKDAVKSAKSEMERIGNTQYSILGKASSTRVPGAHFGQVPYAGLYRSKLGVAVS